MPISAGHGRPGGDADAGAEIGRGLELGADCQRRAAGPRHGVVLRQGPAPETHRGVALEIAHHAALLADVAGHHAQGAAHPLQQPEQIARLPLRFAREAAQIAEHDGDFGLARRQHDLGVFVGQRLEHHGREELAQAWRAGAPGAASAAAN